MKKSIISIFALLLCVCFCFAGCGLFPENKTAINNQEVVSTGNVNLTREEFIKGYNNYYSTFYNQANGDSDEAINLLIKYLVTKKIYLNDAKKLVEQGEITLTNTEKNYLWNATYNSFISNIETFEQEVKNSLGIEEETTEDEKEKESQFVYTPYEKKAEVIFNETTNEYEIKVVKQILIRNEIDGKENYEYVSESEAGSYDDSSLVLYTIEYVFNNLEKDKYFSNKETLTDEEKQSKIISKEAVRRYIEKLKENEDGKNLSTIDKEILTREIERIYGILYDNILITKLYEYKTKDLTINEEDVLRLYLSKVQECYDRYYEDTDAFIEELTKTVGSANLYGNYSTPSKSISDVFYIPTTTENFFYVTHIVVKFTDMQIQQINELKERCESEGRDEAYYLQEYYKIVPDISDTVIGKIIDEQQKLKDGTITQEEYETNLLSIIGSKLLMVDERDGEGYITKEVMTIQEMIASLYKDLADIYLKYKGEAGVAVTLNGKEYTPTEDGLITKAVAEGKSQLVLDELEVKFNNERADKFNEYIYKYSQDTGTIQIQKSYFGTTSENWYLYAMGDGETDNGFVEAFTQTARDLFTKGEITRVETTIMENWSTSDDKETLKSGSTGYSVMMYAGKVNNLFECFDSNKLTLDDLLAEETTKGNAKYYSLLKMDQYRLGLTMNKTLFDLIFEEYYDAMYDEVINIYENQTLKDIDLTPNQKIIDEILG